VLIGRQAQRRAIQWGVKKAVKQDTGGDLPTPVAQIIANRAVPNAEIGPQRVGFLAGRQPVELDGAFDMRRQAERTTLKTAEDRAKRAFDQVQAAVREKLPPRRLGTDGPLVPAYIPQELRGLIANPKYWQATGDEGGYVKRQKR
jgi:hypothetical protein